MLIIRTTQRFFYRSITDWFMKSTDLSFKITVFNVIYCTCYKKIQDTRSKYYLIGGYLIINTSQTYYKV